MPGFNSRSTNAMPVWLADDNGVAAKLTSVQETLNLVVNNGVADAQTVYGGDYLIRAMAINWNGASVTIQYLDADKVTYTPLTNQDGSAVAPFTANRTQAVTLGSNSVLRAVITGTPTGLYIAASRIP